jgi:hypothetical protein
MSILLVLIFLIVISFLVYRFSEAAASIVIGGAAILGGFECDSKQDGSDPKDMSAYDNIYIDGNNFAHVWKNKMNRPYFTAENKAAALYDLGKIMGTRFPNSHIHIITKNQNLIEYNQRDQRSFRAAVKEIKRKSNEYEKYIKNKSAALAEEKINNVFYHLCMDYNPISNEYLASVKHGYFAADDATVITLASGRSRYIYGDAIDKTKKRGNMQTLSAVLSMDSFRDSDLDDMTNVPPFVYIVYNKGNLIVEQNANINYGRYGTPSYSDMYKNIKDHHFGFRLDDYSSDIHKKQAAYKSNIRQIPYCLYLALKDAPESQAQPPAQPPAITIPIPVSNTILNALSNQPNSPPKSTE